MANWLEPIDQSRGGLFDLIREFDNWFGTSSGRSYFGSSDLDIEEQEGNYRIIMDMPGVKAEDVKMEAQGNRLMIQAERMAESRVGGGRSQNSMRYQRVFTLPESVNIDLIEASLENGVLQIFVPKSEEASPRKIQVGSTHRQLAGSAQPTKEKSSKSEAATAQAKH